MIAAIIVICRAYSHETYLDTDSGSFNKLDTLNRSSE